MGPMFLKANKLIPTVQTTKTIITSPINLIITIRRSMI